MVFTVICRYLHGYLVMGPLLELYASVRDAALGGDAGENEVIHFLSLVHPKPISVNLCSSMHDRWNVGRNTQHSCHFDVTQFPIQGTSSHGRHTQHYLESAPPFMKFVSR